jgi:hypothetical protein
MLINKEHWESTTGLKTGIGTYTKGLCQKNEGADKLNKRPIKMGGRTIYRTLPSKRTSFQTGFDR